MASPKLTGSSVGWPGGSPRVETRGRAGAFLLGLLRRDLFLVEVRGRVSDQHLADLLAPSIEGRRCVGLGELTSKFTNSG